MITGSFSIVCDVLRLETGYCQSTMESDIGVQRTKFVATKNEEGYMPYYPCSEALQNDNNEHKLDIQLRQTSGTWSLKMNIINKFSAFKFHRCFH